MNDNKRIWIVSLTITGENDYINTELYTDTCERDARDRLAAFKLRCIKQGDSSVPSYATRVDGSIMKANPEYIDGDSTPTLSEYIPTGGLYHGVMESFDFDPEDLEDSETEWEVEMTVTRIDNITVRVDRASSQDDAEEKAREQVNDGDEDHQLEYPDDMDIEVESCYSV